MAEEKGGQTLTNRQRNLSAIGALVWFIGHIVLTGETGLYKDPEWHSWDIVHFLGGLLLALMGLVIVFESSKSARFFSRYPIWTGLVVIGDAIVLSGGMFWSSGFPKSLSESRGWGPVGILLLYGFYLIIRGRRIRAKQTEPHEPLATDSDSIEADDTSP